MRGRFRVSLSNQVSQGMFKFTDGQETAIVEFVKEHPKLYYKEHGRFHDRLKKEVLWAEISTKMCLQPFDVRKWFESQITRYGKLSKQQSGQAQTVLGLPADGFH